jgi:hypothetical protein
VSNSLPWSGRFALLLFLPAGLLPFVFPGQRINTHVRTSKISDWSTRHVVYPQSGTSRAIDAVRNDPRSAMRWREVEQRQMAARVSAFQTPSALSLRSLLALRGRGRGRVPTFPTRQTVGFHPDWNISLGNGSTAPGMFPAKYQFDVTATASCANDFAVFPVNAGSTNGQPNIVAFNNLYSGTGPTGFCSSRTSPGKTDTKSSPTVLWSYNIHAINPAGTGGAVTTSPVLSLDGTKVAFVESAAGNAAHFHVLAWKTADGQSNNLQTVSGGLEIISFASSAPAAGSGLVTDLQLGTLATGTDTLSSPFIDYANDVAYVGNDIGTLYRIKNVFCTLAACGTALPSLDTSWGSGGAVATGCTGQLTAPVQDFPSSTIYVGCPDGKVYAFGPTGVPIANSPLVVGNGSATGDIADPPIVDALNGFIYIITGTGAAPNTNRAVMVQAKRDLSSPRVSTIGAPNKFSLHSPAFNDSYFTNATNTPAAPWLLYAFSYDVGGTNLAIWASTFDTSRNLSTGAAANTLNFGTRLGEYAPLTEFKNGTTDWLFHGLLITPSNMGENNINSFPTSIPVVATIAAGCTGITGIIVDNSSASAQASSVYFTCTGNSTAYKFTQNGLN